MRTFRLSIPALSTLLCLGLLPLLLPRLPGQEPDKSKQEPASGPTATAPSTAKGGEAKAPPPPTEDSAAARTLAQIQKSGRFLTLPDGSRLHLLPRKGRRIAHWATWVSMGEKDEPYGARGLAEACLRASLLGTESRGSRNWAEEERALDLADQRGFELANAIDQRAKADEIQALRKAFGEARALARRWSKPGSAQRDLAALPIQGPIVRSGADGSLLLASMPSRRLLDFAALMEQRRRTAVLRSFHSELEQVRRVIARNEPGPYLMEARLQAIQTHPMRGSRGLPRFISRAEALRFYHRYQRPERTVTVIVGDFDAERLAESLRGLFTTPGDRADPPPILSPEPAQRGFRESGLELPGDPTIVFAWRIPPGASRSGLELLGKLLGQGPSSLLGRRLLGETHLARSVEMFPAYPGLQQPSLFVLRIICAEWDRDLYERLLVEGRGVVTRLRERGFDESEFALARGSLMADRLALIGDEAKLAARMARDLGTMGKIDLLPPDRKEIESLMDRLLQRSQLTLVRTALRTFDEPDKKVPDEPEKEKEKGAKDQVEKQAEKEEGR